MKTQLSPNNQFLLQEYAQKLLGQTNPHKSENSFLIGSVWIRLSTSFSYYFPITSDTVFEKMGHNISLTYGAPVTNEAIGILAKHLFPKVNPQPRTWLEKLTGNAQYTGQATAAELLKMTITPQILPMVQFILGAGVGIAGPTAIALVSALLARGNAKELKNFQEGDISLDQLIHRDPEGKLRDIFDNELSRKDLQDLKELLGKYDLTCKLLVCEKDKIADFLQPFVIEREDGAFVYQDGAVLSGDERLNFIEARQLLAGSNPTSNGKAIMALLNAIVRHHEPRCEDPSDRRHYLIPCEDGLYCKRDGSLLDMQEVKAILSDLEETRLEQEKKGKAKIEEEYELSEKSFVLVDKEEIVEEPNDPEKKSHHES